LILLANHRLCRRDKKMICRVVRVYKTIPEEASQGETIKGIKYYRLAKSTINENLINQVL
jgi:hypothetical protein